MLVTLNVIDVGPRLNEILDKSRINSKIKMGVIDKYYESAAKLL